MKKNIEKKSASSKTLELGKNPLTLEELFEVSRFHRVVVLSTDAKKRIKAAHEFLKKKSRSGEMIYGVNTGFGILSNVKVQEKDLEKLQVNLLRSHAVGTGEALTKERVRAMVLLRAATLTQGHSGVSVELVEALIALLNHDITPWIPEQGSVGASGDLSPLAHLALVLIGEGRAQVENPREGRKTDWISGAKALESKKLKPIVLGPKEGLALINGTQFMAALGSFALLEAEQLLRVANLAGGMTLEALRGTTTAFDAKIHAVRPHPGQMEVAAEIRKILSFGKPSEIARSHVDCDKVQDPYSLRCIPQVHGASLDTFKFVRTILEREINSVTDNPLVFVKEGEILSGGNFHGQYLAYAMDFLAIAVAELGSISEQRLEKLVNPAISGLPAFLMKKSGLNSGFMIVQVAAASIVSENKTLCHPASVDTIPTSADKEDHVSMGAWAARKCLTVVTNTRRILSMELLAAAQGVDLLRPLRSTPVIEKLHGQIRKVAPYLEEDGPFYELFEGVNELTHNL
jgi:histidine ammonia-lyase